MADLMSGGGVDSSIALRAGQGVAAPPNPLEQIGKFAQVSNLINNGQIQQQTIQSNKMSLAQHMKQLAYAHIAPLVAQGRINNMADLTNALGSLEHYGIVTAPFLQDVSTTTAQGGNFIDNLKVQTLAGMQSPENVGKAIAPQMSIRDVGGQEVPYLSPAPGMPGQGTLTQSDQGITKGLTPGQQIEQKTRPANKEDVAAFAKQGITIQEGQDLSVPQLKFLQDQGYPAGTGGQRVPIGSSVPAASTPEQAVHQNESAGRMRPGEYGDGGAAAGPMQVHQGALNDVNKAWGTNYTHKELADNPQLGKAVGDGYLQMMKDRFKRDDYAMGAYNAGPEAMQRAIDSGKGIAGLPASTRAYVARGMGMLQKGTQQQTTPPSTVAAPPSPVGTSPNAPVQIPPPTIRPTVTSNPSGLLDSQATSAKAYDAALINDSSFQRRIFPLKEAMNAIAKSGGTGPGTETTNYVKSFLQARAPELYKKFAGELSSNQVKNYDLAIKYMADWVGQQGGAARSDMAQTLATTSSPSAKISQGAAMHVMAAALGLENMQHAAATEFTKTQGQGKGGQFLTWMNQNFTPNADPHGYAWGSIPRETRAEIVKGLSPEDKKRLYDSYKRAVDLNLTPAIK